MASRSSDNPVPEASPADPVIGALGLDANLQVAKSTTASGTMQMLFMTIAPPAPCESCYWDYGVTLREKVRYPGVHSNRTNVIEKSYGGTMQYVTSTSGVVDDTFKLLAETDIIKQIANDEGLHIAETRYPMKMTGSAVEARRAYLCTITNAGNTIQFTDADGVAMGTAVTTGASGKLAAEAINADSDLTGHVVAFPTGTPAGATTFIVMSAVNGGLFTIADGGGTGTLTINKRYVVFVSKDEDIQFDALVEPVLGATFSKHSLFTLASTTTAGTTIVNVDGTATGASNDHTTSTTMSSNLNAVLVTAATTGALAVNCCGDTTLDVTYVHGDPAAHNISFTFSAASTTVVSKAYSGYSQYPQLTSEDIFRIFYNEGDGGSLHAMTYHDVPIKDTNYNVYYIKNSGLKITSLHGAGYNQTGEIEYEIYVPSTVAKTSYWDADGGSVAAGYGLMEAPTSADTNFEDLLGILTGLLVSSW
jgi:hypothetical protein